MTTTTANGITIEYDTFGDTGGRPLLLIMGLGAQMTRWRTEFCELLANQGHYVIRFDNRDVGLSQKFDVDDMPDMGTLFARMEAGEVPDVPYTLSDMASDAAGLLDTLGIDTAHVCGASMGGMIVQQMAIDHGHRMRSMTSIMSSTGNPDLPQSTPEARAALTSPAGTTMEEVLARAVKNARVIGSPAYPAPENEIRERAKSDFDRSFYPSGVVRQMIAIAATGNRKPGLQSVSVPTLVIHGKADPLVPVEAGIDTHEAITGSKLRLFDGMGHDLPEPLWPDIVEAITAHTTEHDRAP